MNNILNYKSFNEEAEWNGYTMPNTTEETLTSYYKCNKCNNLFTTFNEEASNCNSCGDNKITKISDFDYFSELKKIADKERFKKELDKKIKRDSSLIDLVDLGDYNKNRERRKSIN